VEVQTEPLDTDPRPYVGERLLSLAAGTVPDLSPVDAVDAAADAGFRAVGVWFDPDTWSSTVLRAVADRLDHRGVAALDVEPIMLGSAADHGEAIIDAAIELGARHVLVASREADDAAVASRLATLVERVERSSVTLVLEFLPSLGVRTFEQASSIVDSVGHASLGVLVDALHLARAGEQPAVLLGAPAGRLPYLQLCDAAAAPSDTSPMGLIREALHERLLPGDGALPLAELLAAVPAVPLSFEVRSAHLRDAFPDPVERARAVMSSVRR
jgi:sugar phosphate isomerase/epimerase